MKPEKEKIFRDNDNDCLNDRDSMLVVPVKLIEKIFDVLISLVYNRKPKF